MKLLDRLLQLDLFGGSSEPAAPPAPPPKRARPSIGGWELVDHACRACLGRVLVRRVKGEAVETRCAECGAHAHAGHLEICCCGADCGSLGYVLECFRNPDVTQAVPQEVLVRERPDRREKPRGKS